MRQRRHALSGALYDVQDDGTILVTDRHGVTGRFSAAGVWISGDLHHCDPHLCGWLAGPQLPPRMAVLPRFRSTESTPTPSEV